MGYIEDRQSNARKSYAQRMREEEERRRKEEEERRRREEARHRAEEERRKREEAQQKAEEQQKAVQQRADDHRRQMERQKQQQTKPAQAATNRATPKSANTFYTTPPSNGIMNPRFNNISAYEDEISKHQEALKALNKQQFNLMLKNDVTGMDALDAPIKQAEGDIDDLKLEMYGVMGAYEHGKKGNQLLEDAKWDGYAPKEDRAAPNMGDMSPTGNVAKPGLSMTNGKPQFSANDTAAHVTGLDDGADSFFGYNPEDYDETKYEKEKQLRTDALQYKPSNNFQTLVYDGLKFAQDNLNNANQLGDTSLIKKYEEEAGLYQTVKDMYTNISPDSTFRYYQMEEGLRAVEGLLVKYTGEVDNAVGLTGHDAAEKLTMIKDQLIDINRGMNVAGEAYLDDIDEKYKKGVISKQDYDTAYKEYYQSVIDRESTIQIPKTSPNEDNLTMANAATGNDLLLFDMLKAYDVPLYNTEEDAVFAFKKEAMPLTIQANKEHSAVLNAIDLLDEDSGKVNTYYYYFDVKQGADRDVIFNAILGARGGEDRMLLHTHPVDGYWSRGFSGNPDGSERGDTSVPTTLGYGGIYVITSGAEAKLHKGPGFANIGSGHSAYANTLDELKYASTIDLY